ncbi:MAG: hypothetical protein AAGC91_03940 [Pseudomonadota bacterium]
MNPENLAGGFRSLRGTLHGRALTGVLLTFLAFSQQVSAQGQDSERYERDRMVIATLLDGRFDNANQNYFDRRGGAEDPQRRRHQRVQPRADLGADVFAVTGYWDSKPAETLAGEVWALRENPQEAAVELWVWAVDDPLADRVRFDDQKPDCVLRWRREAAQFSAERVSECKKSLPGEVVISDRELWVRPSDAQTAYRLHRARPFFCYADVPGVGGGRDEPYERYGDFPLHDQGDLHWFTTKEGRRLGVSLFLVDWPINNYEEMFARDSLVVYLSEELVDSDGEVSVKQHGYSFTVPEADRIGLNLKWALVNCFMQSNRDATPSM